MLVTGLIKAFSKYNKSFKSRGILIESKEGERWYNFYGSEDEVNTMIKGLNIGNSIVIETTSDTSTTIKGVVKAGKTKELIKKEKIEIPEQPYEDKNLHKIVAMMNRSFIEAKEVLRNHVRQDLLEQPQLIKVALEIFKSWREVNAK